MSTFDPGVGDRFTGHPKFMALSRMRAFSGGSLEDDGWPKANVHTDLPFAERVGLKVRVASATQLQGHLAELMIDAAGPQWLTNGQMKVKFVGVVADGDTVTTAAVVSENDAAGIVSLDVETTNQHGDLVMVGTAVAHADRSGEADRSAEGDQ